MTKPSYWDAATRALAGQDAVLARLIAAYPGIVSTRLAQRMKMERQEFKINVRKLKELGLTESLEIGYRLSPLGEAFMKVRA